MTPAMKTIALATAAVLTSTLTSARAAEREQVRMVINLIAGVKMPFPENLRNNVSRTERVQLDTNGATIACLRLDDKIRWCYEHIAPVGARAEMLRIRNEPVPGLLVGQLYHYVDDFDLDGSIDIGSTTKLEGDRTPRSARSSNSSIARRTGGSNFVRTIKRYMTRASKWHSSTWESSLFLGRSLFV